MLEKIVIDGYKSIDNQTLEFAAFNLLAGVNSAGKSTVIQAIILAWQVICTWGQGDKSLNIVYGKFTDLRNSIKGNKIINISLSAKTMGQKSIDEEVSVLFKDGNNVVQLSDSNLKQWEDYVKNYHLIYLSAERMGVTDSYPVNTADSFAIGDKGEFAYAYMAMHGQEPIVENAFAYQPEAIGKSLNNQVNYWLGYILGFRVQAKSVQDLDQVVATFSNVHDNRYYRGKNVGTGVSFVAMLLIAALSCHKGDTLIIENPEIHLHPRAQSRFMECMSFLSNQGLQIILETHSDHIYNGMRKCIKKKELAKEAVAAYFLELDDTMQTKICRIYYNDEGAEENHPYGMFDQFDDDLDDLLGL